MADEILSSFDAQVWADGFMKTLADNPQLKVDQELMLVWFSNALMRGYDEHYWRSPEYKRQVRRGAASSSQSAEPTVAQHEILGTCPNDKNPHPVQYGHCHGWKPLSVAESAPEPPSQRTCPKCGSSQKLPTFTCHNAWHYAGGGSTGERAEPEAWLIECKPKDGSDTWKWLGLPRSSELRARQSAYGNPAYDYRIVRLFRD